MSKAVELSTVEQEFGLEILKQGLRADGRDHNQFRDVEIELGEEYGYVDVKLGKTR